MTVSVPRTATRPGTVLPFASPQATLRLVGGKGLNLARLAQAGFPVPTGFLLTTHAYDRFVEQAGLRAWIEKQLLGVATDDPDTLAALSRRIRRRFSVNALPQDIREALLEAYAELGAPPVAVRSSATAEDLPDLSFAGQQDTFLNVLGAEALLEAVVNCWSSLWTARAIGYRTRNGIDHREVSLAVVVQEMVQSDVSGVLFTANPLTGRRTETVIDATFGLGEALVSGQVEPDHYVVETAGGRILEKRLGAKATVIRGRDGGGTITEAGGGVPTPALSDAQVRQLADLGRRVAAFYASPQDIEWAFAAGSLYLLQSRPITSLFPLPNIGDADDLHLFFSFGAVQGMFDPMTPLGQDVIRLAFAGGAGLFGYDVDFRSQRAIHTAAERLWIDLTGLVRNRVGRKVFQAAFRLIESGGAESLEEILADPRLAPTGGIGRSTMARLRPSLGRAWPVLLRTLCSPDASRRALLRLGDALVEAYRIRFQRAGTLAEQLDVFEALVRGAFQVILPQFVPRIAVGYGSFYRLQSLIDYLATVDPAVSPQTVLTLTRGLPHNVTTEMDLSLWRTAQAMRVDPQAAAAIRTGAPEDLAQRYRQGRLPPTAQRALDDFLEKYGMRGLAEIDIGRPRWRENPVPVLQTLQSYLAIDDPNAAPDVVFRRGAQAAAAAMDELAATAHRLRGPALAWLVRRLAERVRALAGLREYPKFTIIRLLGICREALLASGAELAASGVLARADDLFFLHLDELNVLAMGAPGDWQRLVEARRSRYARERLRQPIPRLLLSDGTAIYAGIRTAEDAGANVIMGSPVSPGVVEGAVRVVLDPHKTQLQPGEILVCPGTDPAWTPLFLAAGGLITEVGGMMTHGSVVAREYGIPAVVGVDRATERLQTGQRVRVDGTRGEILVLDE